MLLATIWLPLSAATINETDHFYCGFGTEEEFKEWTKVDLNGLATNGNSDWWWDGTEKVAFISTALDKGLDDVLISPAVTLTGGKTYSLKMNIWADTGKETIFELRMGNSATKEAQTVSIGKIDHRAGAKFVCFDLPEGTKAGTYYFSLHVTVGSSAGPVHLRGFEIVEKQASTLSVLVKDKKEQTVVSGANVTLSGTSYSAYTLTTNEEGTCTFDLLTAGDYQVKVEKEGLETVEGQVVVIAKDKAESCTVELEKSQSSTIEGWVAHLGGYAIPGVTAVLKGEGGTFTCVTTEWGDFKFEKVPYSDVPYVLTFSKEFKETLKKEVRVQEPSINLDKVELADLLGTPVQITYEQNKQGMLLSWMAPVQEKIFAYDNETYAGSYQLNAPYALAAVAFNEPMVLNSVNWAVAEIPDEKVDIYVYAINEQGEYTKDVIYEAKGVSTVNHLPDTPIEWNEHKLADPVVAPYGCIVAIGHTGMVTVGSDYQKNSFTSLLSSNLESGWRTSSVSNFLVRANGTLLTASLAPDAFATNYRSVSFPKQKKVTAKQIEGQKFSYTVSRFKVADKENTAAWTEVGSKIKEVFYLDLGFNKLEAGTYMYAIQTVMENGDKSDYCFSEPIERDLRTNLTVNILTDTAIDFASGATVKLVNVDDETIVYTATAKNKDLVVSDILKGKYVMTVSKEGFASVQKELTLDQKNSYQTEVEMRLTPIAPFNLNAEQEEGTNNVVLSWNKASGIFEDFEGMEDFAINPAGKTGWTYVDKDGDKTYGIAQCEKNPYTNMYAPMAFMAFNPSATTPSVLDLMQPFSGQKMLVDVSLQNGGVNDDYLFSPELDFSSDFVLSFYAASGFYAIMGNEEFMVGYTTGAATPENVVWITKEVQTVGAMWTQFSYNMPKEARHIVIRCVSNQHMFFLIDDIFIGQKEPDVFAMTTFNVFLDEELIANSASRSVMMENLEATKHIAKVQAVYPMYDDTKQYSEFTEIVFEVKEAAGIGTDAMDVLYTYDAETGVVTPGAHTDRIEMFSMQGHCCASCVQGETIDTNRYSAGVYVLKVKSGDKISFGKIVVK